MKNKPETRRERFARYKKQDALAKLANERHRKRLQPFIGKRVKYRKGHDYRVGVLLRFVGKGPNCIIQMQKPTPGNPCSYMVWLCPMNEVKAVKRKPSR